jgi:hypothetical protein
MQVRAGMVLLAFSFCAILRTHYANWHKVGGLSTGNEALSGITNHAAYRSVLRPGFLT